MRGTTPVVRRDDRGSGGREGAETPPPSFILPAFPFPARRKFLRSMSPCGTEVHLSLSTLTKPELCVDMTRAAHVPRGALVASALLAFGVASASSALSVQLSRGGGSSGQTRGLGGHRRLLEAAAAVPVEDCENLEYTGTIGLGTPVQEFRVVFSIVSSYLWVSLVRVFSPLVPLCAFSIEEDALFARNPVGSAFCASQRLVQLVASAEMSKIGFCGVDMRSVRALIVALVLCTSVPCFW